MILLDKLKITNNSLRHVNQYQTVNFNSSCGRGLRIETFDILQ